MSERFPDRQANEDPSVGVDPESAPSTPGWIKFLGIAVAVLIFLMFVVLHLMGAVGPGAH